MNQFFRSLLVVSFMVSASYVVPAQPQKLTRANRLAHLGKAAVYGELGVVLGGLGCVFIMVTDDHKVVISGVALVLAAIPLFLHGAEYTARSCGIGTLTAIIDQNKNKMAWVHAGSSLLCILLSLRLLQNNKNSEKDRVYYSLQAHVLGGAAVLGYELYKNIF